MSEKNTTRIIFEHIKQPSPEDYQQQIRSLQVELLEVRTVAGLTETDELVPTEVTIPGIATEVIVSSVQPDEAVVQIVDERSAFASIYYTPDGLTTEHRDGAMQRLRADTEGFQTVQFMSSAFRATVENLRTE